MTTTNIPAPEESLIDRMEAEKYKAAFVWVSPEIAKRWLGRNEKNRPIGPTTKSRYVRDMNAGRWVFTGEPIKFAADGTLIDGQHRLEALIAHGKPILMMVVRGLDKAAQDVMDTGRKRSAADMLSMHEKSSAAKVAAIAKLVVAWRQGNIKTCAAQSFGEISHSEILAVVESDPYVTWASTVGIGVRANPAAVGFAAWMAGQVDAESIRSFLSDIAEIRTSGTGDPRNTLLRRLAVARDQRERLTSVEQAYLIVRAWDAYRRGEPLKQLKLSAGAGPMPFPVLAP